MYQRILLAYDGSESGRNALLGCQEIAQWSRAELHLVAVMPSPAVYIAVDGGFYDSGRDDEDRRRFRAVLDDGLRRLQEAGHSPTRGELLTGDAVQEITDYAQKIQADLIVVGHKHLKGWAARWWRGSTSASLIENSSCSVLVVITR